MAERQQASRIEPFMMAQPRVDIGALRRPRARRCPTKDRMAMARERPPTPPTSSRSLAETRGSQRKRGASVRAAAGRRRRPPPQSAGNSGDVRGPPREAQTGYVVPDRGTPEGQVRRRTARSHPDPAGHPRVPRRRARQSVPLCRAESRAREPTVAAASAGSRSSSTRKVSISGRGSARSRRR